MSSYVVLIMIQSHLTVMAMTCTLVHFRKAIFVISMPLIKMGTSAHIMVVTIRWLCIIPRPLQMETVTKILSKMRPFSIDGAILILVLVSFAPVTIALWVYVHDYPLHRASSIASCQLGQVKAYFPPGSIVQALTWPSWKTKEQEVMLLALCLRLVAKKWRNA